MSEFLIGFKGANAESLFRAKIFEAFLKRQCEEGMELAQSSDLLELYPIGGDPPDRPGRSDKY